MTGLYADLIPADVSERTRARRIGDTFKAWRQREGGKAQPLDIEGSCLADALRSACASCGHKDVIFILQTIPSCPDKALHVYVIRQGPRQHRVNPETGVPGWFHPLKTDNLFSLPVRQFEPVEPWRWSPGADVVGADRETIDAR